MPSKVFDINESDPDVAVSLEGLTVYEEDAWWNQIPLNNLDLSSNQLTQISNRLEKLTSLTCLSVNLQTNNYNLFLIRNINNPIIMCLTYLIFLLALR